MQELKFRSALLKAMELRLAFAADDKHLVAASSQLRDLVEKFDVDAMKAAMARSLPDVIGFQEAILEASTAYASATEANWDTELAGFCRGPSDQHDEHLVARQSRVVLAEPHRGRSLGCAWRHELHELDDAPCQAHEAVAHGSVAEQRWRRSAHQRCR